MTVKTFALTLYILFAASALVGAIHIANWIEQITRVHQNGF